MHSLLNHFQFFQIKNRSLKKVLSILNPEIQPNDTHSKDITDLSDCDFEYHDIILPSYKKGFIKYVDKIKRFRKYHPTVENLLKPGKIDFSLLFFL